MMVRYGIALVALACAPAWAVNRCEAGGKVVFQDAPCPQARETVAQGLKQRERIEAYHRRLDQMQARGVGLLQRAPPPPPPPPRVDDAETASVRIRRESRAERTARWDAEMARLTAQTIVKNEASRQALIEELDATQQGCGSALPDLPVVGMSDAFFRNCTLHARFGGATQIVAVEEDGVPLRLYVFPRGRAERVYSVDGVVTAVKP
jgi:hypothetical protein